MANRISDAVKNKQLKSEYCILSFKVNKLGMDLLFKIHIEQDWETGGFLYLATLSKLAWIYPIKNFMLWSQCSCLC